MKTLTVSFLSFLFVMSALALAPRVHGANTSTTIQYVKAAWGNQSGQVVFGSRIGITNATYLGSITINNHEVAYYQLGEGEHYVTDAPEKKDLEWSQIQELAQVKMENFNVAAGNNIVTKDFGTAEQVFSSSDEIEGIEIIGEYAYITYRRTSNNIEMRKVSDFSLVKAISIGDSTYYHVGGIVYDGKGHLWTVLGKTSDSGPSYVYEFDLNLSEITHFETDNDHYGAVFYADSNIVILGNWDCDQLASFNTTTHNLLWKSNTPDGFKTTQDTAYLGGGYYIGARYREDYNYSGLYLYHWDGTNITFDTNLIAYELTGYNPVAVDGDGNIYALSTNGAVYKSADVFLPVIYVDIVSGDKYNLGFSDTWPCQDSGSEQYVISGTGTDTAVGFEMAYSGSITRTTVVSGATTGIFKWAYWGDYTNVNGVDVKGGLPTSSSLTDFGAQTWNSASQSLQGSAYLLKAVPYIVYTLPIDSNETDDNSNDDNGTGGAGAVTPPAPWWQAAYDYFRANYLLIGAIGLAVIVLVAVAAKRR